MLSGMSPARICSLMEGSREEMEIPPTFTQKHHHLSSSVRQETLEENAEENEKC